MTRDDYIFRNASEIAEQRIRIGRKLQAKETEQTCKAAVVALGHWLGRLMVLRRKPKSIAS